MFRLADILQIAAVTPSVVIFLFLLYVSQMFGYFCLHFCFFLASFLAKCVCVCFFFFDIVYSSINTTAIRHQEFSVLSFFLKIILCCSIPIRISQTSSKADCEELVVGALIQSSSLSTIQQSKKTQQTLCVCVAFLLLTVKCNLLVSIGNSMICSDVWHKYHE